MKNKTRKTGKIFTKLVTLVLSVGICLNALSACTDKGDSSGGGTTANQYYDPTAGIDFDKPIGSLVQNGATDYKIAVPAEAHPAEKYAANELQKYVKQSTGTTLSIVTDDSGVALGESLICIGDTKFVNETGLDTKNLNVDGFKIKTSGKTVLIKGEHERGTLYGAYHFLETLLGVRFLTKETEYVPQHTTVGLYEMDVTEIPEFQIRGHQNDDRTATWQAKLRCVHPMIHLEGEKSDELGGTYNMDWTSLNMHSYNGYANRTNDIAQHPDWFAPISSGKGLGQIHLSHGLNDDGTIDETQEDSLIKHIIEVIEQRILEKPTAIYIPLGQNDNNDYCTGIGCNNKCVRQRELFGGHSGHNIVWANAIAREVTKWAKEQGIERDFQFVIYAYMYNQAPPKTDAPLYELATPDDNVAIMLCPYNGTNYNAPIKSMEYNSYFYNVFEGWRNVAKNLFIFDYVVDFCHYLTWYPHYNVIKANLEYYKELGVSVMMSDGSGGGYQDGLRSWLLSKLEWNLNRDVNALVKEYNYYVFGEKAGKVIDDYFNFNNVHFEHAAIYDGNNRYMLPVYGTIGQDYHLSSKTLSVNYIRAAYGYVEKARAIIESDLTISNKVRTQRLKELTKVEVEIDYMKHVNFDELFSTTEEADKEFYRNFQKHVNELGIELFANHVTAKDVFFEKGLY